MTVGRGFINSSVARVKLFWQLIRAPQWWNYKIPLALTASYAFAYAHQINFRHLFLSTFLIVVSGFISASFASLINDFCDLEQDKAAGKETVLMRFASSRRVVMLAAATFASVLMTVFLFQFPVSQIIFACISLIFVAYSMPPSRLKERGLPGVLSISLGEHLLPALLATYLVAESTGVRVDARWIIAVGGWSAAFGLRGILWHQISDLSSDEKAHCSTLAVRLGAATLARVARLFVFPIECSAMFYMLALTNCKIAWCALLLYGFLEAIRSKYMFANIIIVEPKPNARFVLFEYYQLVLPLSLLVSASLKDLRVSLLLIVFVVLFAAPVSQSAHHIIHLVKSDLYQALRRRVLRQS